jgi:peroxiredoxin
LPSTIEQVHREYKPRGLEVVAINIDESRRTVAEWVAQRTVSSHVLLDPGGTVTRAYGVTATPTVFVLGRDGKLIAKALGTKAWTSPRGRALLEALLAQ